MSGPAQIERETAASTVIPGNCSYSDGADASITESPTAVISVPSGMSICSGSSSDSSGAAFAASFMACSPAAIAAAAEVTGGAVTIAAAVPPTATAPTASAVAPARRAIGRPVMRERKARHVRRNPYRRSGCSTNRYDSAANRYDSAAAPTEITSATAPIHTGTPASGPVFCVATSASTSTGQCHR